MLPAVDIPKTLGYGPNHHEGKDPALIGGSKIESKGENMLNKVMLIGNLGRDPEMRYTQGGTAVANFTMATKERWKDTKSGEFQERTEWHRIVVWGKLAEICGQYLNKGKLVFIEGRLQTRDWEDKEGNKRSTTEIVASEMKMLGAKGGSSEGGQGRMATEPDLAPAEPSFNAPEDDIPF